MEKDIRDQFERFLMENDCFSQFCINLLEQKHLTFEEYVEKHIETYGLPNNRHRNDEIHFWNFILLDAFWYCDTPQREEYWMRIYYKWEKKYF